MKMFSGGWMSTCVFLSLTVLARGGETLRVKGSSTLAQAVVLAAPVLRSEFGIEVKFVAEGGSTQAIVAVGAESADVAMATRALTAEDRANFPERRFEEIQIGTQALAVVVPRDVWNSGVRALTQAQLVAIYEGDIRSWKQVGGEDRPIKFYSPERGRGIWEFLVTWLYGDIRRAPIGKGSETVSNPRDARDLLEFNAGSLAIAPPQFADGKSVFALALQLANGEIVEPNLPNIVSGKYPLARPLVLVSGDRPTGAVKKLFDLMLSPRGQQFLTKAGFVPRQDAGQ
jgi:phosphate transport system substrate-binding protein